MSVAQQPPPIPSDLEAAIADLVRQHLAKADPPAANVHRLVSADQIQAGHEDRRRKRWALAEEHAAQALRDAGWSFDYIGAALGRTADGVRRRLEDLHGR